jgi:cytochrome c-type biogenesis protein CcmH/NrfG
MWVVHTGVDWDWEMPVLGAPLLGLCALAVATPPRARAAAPGGMRRIVPALVLLVLAITPVTVVVSQNRLNASVQAFRDGDCERSIALALDSVSALPVRPEPFQVMGFCDTREGRHEVAERVMRNAVRLDPDNWEFHYSLALVLAAAGRDPRPALARALALDPRSPLLRRVTRRFAGAEATVWQRRALDAPLPFQR